MKRLVLSVIYCLMTFANVAILAQTRTSAPASQTASAGTRQTLLFNNNWKFYKGDATGADKSSFDDNAWRQLDLPHDWSIEGPFDEKWASATGYLPAGVGWYRKTFTLAAALRAKQVFIYFDGVYNNSEVWINGHYLGKRPNGFIPFQYELTPYLNPAGNNIISVKADHSQFADSRWYTGSGIYRNVYLIATNNISIDQWGVGFSTPQVSAEKALANIAVSFTNNSAAAGSVVVKSRLINAQGNAVAETQKTIQAAKGASVNAKMNLAINNPLLWSIENPSLYKLEVSLSVNGKKTDEVIQNVGIRSFKFDADKGFFLNGKSLKHKGLCIHDDAGALGVAVPEEVWERRLQILKDGGCNSLRLSHNPHADYLYDLCDRMGFLVIDEAFDEWEVGKNKWIKGWNVGTPGNDGYHSDFKEWADRDVKDMVLRSRNHPSIILWSIGNEIDYPNDPYTHPILNTGRNPQIYGRGYTPAKPAASRLTEIAKQLVAAVKKYDTTRPVTAALAGVVMSNEVGFPEELDVVGYNYQEYRYPDDHKKYPNRIMHGSENGHQFANWTAVVNNEYISGQYLWTGIDYLGEARQWPSRSAAAGLIDLAGFKKPQYYFRQSLWSANPMVYISTFAVIRDSVNYTGNNRFGRNGIASWNYKQGDSVLVNGFTNCSAAELFLNGKSLGKKTLAEAVDGIIVWRTVYQPGELLIKGYNDEKEINAYTIKTAGEPYAIKASADKSSLAKNKKQLTHVEITIVDKNGVIVPDAENEVSVTIDGPATLLGLESGSFVSHEDYKSNKRKALRGKLLAYVQGQQKAGIIKIKITSAGLQPTVIALPIQ